MMCERCENEVCTCGYISGVKVLWNPNLQTYVLLFYGEQAKQLRDEWVRRHA